MKIICSAAFKRFTPGKTVVDIFGGTTCTSVLVTNGSPYLVCI